MVRLATPPGIRSCREGGRWDGCRDPSSGRNHWIIEYEALLGGESTTEAAAVLRAELFDLLSRAEAGECTYGTAAQGRNVEQMVSAPTILELRLGYWSGDEDQPRLVRLYFSEPEHVPGCLYAAKLAAKRPGPLGLEEQTRHAREAAVRVERALGGR